MLSSSSHQSSNEWIMNCYWSVHDTNEIIYGLYKYDVCRIFFKNDEVYLQRKSVLRSQSLKNSFFWITANFRLCLIFQNKAQDHSNGTQHYDLQGAGKFSLFFSIVHDGIDKLAHCTFLQIHFLAAYFHIVNHVENKFSWVFFSISQRIMLSSELLGLAESLNTGRHLW